MEKDKSFNPTRSRIRVVRNYPHTNAALVCEQCEDLPCVYACPRKALSQSENNGAIIVNDDLCDGCGWCVKSCKTGAIALDPKPTVRICDLCADRDAGPTCVEWCPEEALELTTHEILDKKKNPADQNPGTEKAAVTEAAKAENVKNTAGAEGVLCQTV